MSVPGTIPEHHVDLDRVVQSHRDSWRKQVTPAHDVFPRVLNRGDDRNTAGPTLRQQETERLLKSVGDGSVGQGCQRGELVDDEKDVRVVNAGRVYTQATFG